MAAAPKPVAGARAHWVQIAVGMKDDLQAYQQLQELLRTQFHAALRHDAAGMAQVAQQISAQAQLLEASRVRRVAHARALLPAGATLSMTAVLALLQSPLKEQLSRLWAQLQQQVQACKAMNLQNCEIIMDQAQTMRQIVQGRSAEEGIYGPV